MNEFGIEDITPKIKKVPGRKPGYKRTPEEIAKQKATRKLTEANKEQQPTQ